MSMQMEQWRREERNRLQGTKMKVRHSFISIDDRIPTVVAIPHVTNDDWCCVVFVR